MKTIKLNKRDLQQYISQRESNDTATADDWFKSKGLNPQIVASTHGKLLEAMQRATSCLHEHRHLLTESEIKILQNFQKKMNTGHIRKKLKPSAAKAIFNISTRTKRKAHKQEKAQ